MSNHKNIPFYQSRQYSLLGTLLLTAIVIQYSMGWRWDALYTLQMNMAYKQITGFMLFSIFLYQWYLGLSRYQKSQNTKSMTIIHRYIGLGLPVLFYFHSLKSGFAYQNMIWFLFLLTCLTAYLHPDIFNSRARKLKQIWFITHISLVSLLTTLLFYHLYIVYAYS